VAVIPEEVQAMGAPVRVRGPLSEAAAGWVDGHPGIHRALARRHAAGTMEISPQDA
jgi:hypothetical protein